MRTYADDCVNKSCVFLEIFNKFQFAICDLRFCVFAFLRFAFYIFLDIFVERMAYCGGEVLWVCISKFHIWCKTNIIFHSLSFTKNKSAQTLRHSKNVLCNVWRKLFMYGWCIASEFERPATVKDSQRYGWGSDVSFH
jgi:hypothetical protein